MASEGCRNLILVLGDQLDEDNAALAAGDPERDRVLMIETLGEAAHVHSHKHRIAVFLSAMRHYAASLRDDGWRVDYATLDRGCPSLAAGVREAAGTHAPQALHAVEPGEWRVQHGLSTACGQLGLGLELHADGHFLASREDFAGWAKGRKRLVMEHFYREMRRRHDVLMDGDEPLGGEWNYDEENRESFGRDGPGELPERPRFEPDETTREVIEAVNGHCADHPGSLDDFAWPVTRAQAREALRDFIEHRLPRFGKYQDAMWQGEPFLHHSLLSSCLNLKLLNPREVVAAATAALGGDGAPLAAVEGFVRQILGWREFVRGVYWMEMPGYRELNHYGHDTPLPEFFWNAETELNCLRQTFGDTLANGYAHHIQRLMIIGNFSVLAGLSPQAVCDWFLAVYVDAVEWVELPNTLGMALHGDGGIVGTKPYVSSAAYIDRMSNYCKDCRYDRKARHGDDACPFNYLYWDFLRRNRQSLAQKSRMRMVLKNLDRWEDEELDAISDSAEAFRNALAQ